MMNDYYRQHGASIQLALSGNIRIKSVMLNRDMHPTEQRQNYRTHIFISTKQNEKNTNKQK